MTAPEYIAGLDGLNMLRKRLVRDRKAAEREIDLLKPLTVPRFTGSERHPADDNAQAAIAKLVAFLEAIDQAEDALA
jgi:hypothetical protein